MLEIFDKLQAKAMGRYPLFTMVILRTKIEEGDETVKTMACNMDTIYYNSNFVMSRTPKDLFFIYLHEIIHLFCGHPLRWRKEYIEEYWQAAADYEDNAILIEDGLTRPADALYEYKYRGWPAEDIYEMIKKYPPPPNEDSRGKMLPPDKDQTEEERQELIEENRQEQIKAVQMAQNCGSLPDSMKRMLEDMIAPRRNWKEELAELLIKATNYDDYTYTKPNRRSDEDDDIILPSLYSEEVPVICVVGDTSGSISKDRLKEIGGDILSLVEDVEPEEIHMLWCDSKVHNPQVFDAYSTIKLEPVGGGGTDFKPPFKYIEEKGLDVECLIYFTDGYCYSFPPEPDFPVIWVVWQSRSPFTPPFGTVLVM